jgi:LmbE family N-acetylglucosaminyl deacetylase
MRLEGLGNSVFPSENGVQILEERRRWARQGEDLFGHGFQRAFEPFGESLARERFSCFCAQPDDPSPAPSTMIVVAHQDDEVIGAGARLRRLKDASLVHVTDGAPRNLRHTVDAGFETRNEYAAARRSEMLAALSLAGIGPERNQTLGIVDQETTLNLVPLSRTLAGLIEREKPEVVLTHSYEGGHTDHDSTAFAVQAACELLRRDGTPIPTVLELTSYHCRSGNRTYFEFLPWAGAEVWTVLLTDEERELKREMFRCFRSQWKVLRRFPLEFERFREAPRYDFTRPPHPGVLDFERFEVPLTGATWRTHARRALEALGIAQHAV